MKIHVELGALIELFGKKYDMQSYEVTCTGNNEREEERLHVSLLAADGTQAEIAISRTQGCA